MKDEPVLSLDVIVGEKLSAVTFVLDYWQLQFDGPIMNVLTRIEVDNTHSHVKDGDDQFRNRLCEQLGKIVTRVDVEQRKALTIVFEDQSSIAISLRPDDYPGPEAVLLWGTNRSSLLVIRED